eukprot:4451282-Prymnesium_polylepis.2
MWGVTPSDRWDWAALRAKIAQHGVRNSLLVAPMPTASTAQILGNNECFEPYTSNIYSRRVLAGEFGELPAQFRRLRTRPTKGRSRDEGVRCVHCLSHHVCLRARQPWSTSTCCAT